LGREEHMLEGPVPKIPLQFNTVSIIDVDAHGILAFFWGG
jgi:hypothetical protein